MRTAVAVLTGLLAMGIAAAALGQARHYEVTVVPAGGKQDGYVKTKVSASALGDATIRLWMNTSIDPDCSPHIPAPTLTVLEQPAHGAVKISDDPFFAAFPPANPRSACNKQKVPGHQAFYTAQSGFKGHDHVVLQGAAPDIGRVRRIDVDIDVR
jgi:hypothetical protein